MNKKHFFTIILASLLLTACRTPPPKYEPADEEHHVLAAAATIPSSAHDGIEVETVFVKDKKYQYSIRVPKLNSKRWNKEIDRSLNRTAARFINKAKKLPAGGGNPPHELHIDFDIYEASDELLSVRLNESVRFAGQKPREKTQTFNFDRKNETFIKLSDLFASPLNSRKQLSHLLEKKLFRTEADPFAETQSTPKHQQTQIDYEQFLVNNDQLILLLKPQHPNQSSPQPKHAEIAISKHELAGLLKNGTPVYKTPDQTPGLDNTRIALPDTIPETPPRPYPDKKQVAITFDDGPHQQVTPQILDTLAKYDARATFFVLGSRAATHPDIVQRAVQEGHEIGNHTWSHPRLKNLSRSEIIDQFNRTEQQIAKTIRRKPPFIRPPYGEVNEAVLSSATGPIINWSVDTFDWKTRNPDAIFAEIQKQVKDGSIILMHDIYPSTAQSLEKVLNWLSRQGYEMVTVSELLGLSPETAAKEAGKIYSLRKT